jgi:hypothetical protein
MTETPQQRLWKLPSYRALNDKRRRLATGILLEGLSLTAACRLLGGLNSTREAKNADLQQCLTDFRACSPTSVLSPEAALECLHEAADRLERERALRDPRLSPVRSDREYDCEKCGRHSSPGYLCFWCGADNPDTAARRRAVRSEKEASL